MIAYYYLASLTVTKGRWIRLSGPLVNVIRTWVSARYLYLSTEILRVLSASNSGQTQCRSVMPLAGLSLLDLLASTLTALAADSTKRRTCEAWTIILPTGYGVLTCLVIGSMVSNP